MLGQIYKAHSDSYEVFCNGSIVICTARGILKKDKEKLAVGDFVEVENNLISRVKERKNLFIRPYVANIDVMVVVISPDPKPDYYLIDKLLINAYAKDIPIIFAVNKSDVDGELFKTIKDQYEPLGVDILSLSAKNRLGTEELKDKLRGKLAVFAGQSAVGKTSLINAMFNLKLKTGELSEKIRRGKHTTTYSTIHAFSDVKIIDSPGFAVIDAMVSAKELSEFYPEFLSYNDSCRFRGCTHTAEPDCAVKSAVSDGKINKDRYERYLEIYKELLKRREIYEKN